MEQDDKSDYKSPALEAPRKGEWLRSNLPIPIAVILWLAVSVWAWWLISPQGQDHRIEWLKSSAQAGVALFVAMGLIYTHRTVENSRKTLDHQRKALAEQLKTQQAEREHQRLSDQNERFFKAVELLGRDGSDGSHIGALFALEQLANESDDHYQQVIEATCAFVRSRSRQLSSNRGARYPKPSKASEDVVVAFTILGRRRNRLGQGEQFGLDLRGAYLRGLDHVKGDFQLGNFTGADLSDATFDETNFAGARFHEVNLRRTRFNDCILIGARFIDVELESTYVSLSASLMPDPYPSIATESISGVPPRQMTVYVYEHDPQYTDEYVNCGRYLDHSTWISDHLEALTIVDASLVWADPEHPMDLSQLSVGLGTEYEKINKAVGAVPPPDLYYGAL